MVKTMKIPTAVLLVVMIGAGEAGVVAYGQSLREPVPVYIGPQVNRAAADATVGRDYWDAASLPVPQSAQSYAMYHGPGIDSGGKGCTYVAPGVPREWCLYWAEETWRLHPAGGAQP